MKGETWVKLKVLKKQKIKVTFIVLKKKRPSQKKRTFKNKYIIRIILALKLDSLSNL
jgi:hypothetical protein